MFKEVYVSEPDPSNLQNIFRVILHCYFVSCEIRRIVYLGIMTGFRGFCLYKQPVSFMLLFTVKTTKSMIKIDLKYS